MSKFIETMSTEVINNVIAYVEAIENNAACRRWYADTMRETMRVATSDDSTEREKDIAWNTYYSLKDEKDGIGKLYKYTATKADKDLKKVCGGVFAKKADIVKAIKAWFSTTCGVTVDNAFCGKVINAGGRMASVKALEMSNGTQATAWNGGNIVKMCYLLTFENLVKSKKVKFQCNAYLQAKYTKKSK